MGLLKIHNGDNYAHAQTSNAHKNNVDTAICDEVEKLFGIVLIFETHNE